MEEYIEKARRSDNIDSALWELDQADHTISTYVDDEDTKQDYFSSASIVRLMLEQLSWEAYIDVLIEEVKQEFTSPDAINEHTKRLEKLKTYVIDLSNFAKEHY